MLLSEPHGNAEGPLREMALLKNNAGVLLAFVALIVMSSALSSCHAAETCYTYPSCSVYPCQIYCINRGFSKDGAYCKENGEAFCCCRQK
ncbi:hypothetical protein ACP70R_045357 [Stipagrostis hirtigluma subsp. patula]